MLDNVEGIEQQLRQSIADESSYKHPEPWRYPKPRSLEDYKKPLQDVSEARKWELTHVPWEENEWWNRDPLKPAVVNGAFDAGSLGGGHNVIKLRRAGFQPLEGDKNGLGESLHAQFGATEKIEERESQKVTKKLENAPMKFLGKHKPARPNMVDKYFTQIRDGDAQHHALRFDKRRADQWLQKMEDGNMLSQGTAAKYGKGPAFEIVQTLPSSYRHTELYVEEPRTSEHPFQLAKDCSRPVAPHGPGVLSTGKQRIYVNSKRTPLNAEECNGRTFKRPPQGSLSAR